MGAGEGALDDIGVSFPFLSTTGTREAFDERDCTRQLKLAKQDWDGRRPIEGMIITFVSESSFGSRV